MKKKKKLLAGLIPGTEEYILKHYEWRRSRGKRNPSECLTQIKNGEEEVEFFSGTDAATRKHNEWIRLNRRPKPKFEVIRNPHRSLLIAQRHQKQFSANPEKFADKEYRDEIISSVTTFDGKAGGSYAITTDGWSISVETKEIVPKAGDVVRYYSRGIGSTVRGIDIEGVQIRYESERQLILKYKKLSMREDRKRKEYFKSIESSLDEKLNELPFVFQKRIERFRQNNLNFRWEHEEGEILLAEESLKVAKFLHSQTTLFNKVGMGEIHPQLDWAYAEEVKKAYNIFREYSDDEMEKLIPDFIGGHSGNTFQFVFRMAVAYLTNEESIPYQHGVFYMFDGCLAYGCHRKYSKKERKQMITLENVDEDQSFQITLNRMKKKAKRAYALEN